MLIVQGTNIIMNNKIGLFLQKIINGISNFEHNVSFGLLSSNIVVLAKKKES